VLARVMKKYGKKGDITHEIDKILQKHSVIRNLYHSGSLNGQHCQNLLKHSQAILEEIEVLYNRADIRRQEVLLP